MELDRPEESRKRRKMKVTFRQIAIWGIIIVIVGNSLCLFLLHQKLKVHIIANTEHEAEGIVNYFAATTKIDVFESVDLRKDRPVFNQLNQTFASFNLWKLKLYDKTGKTIYSTDLEDIGKINTHDYFHNQVKAGEIYSILVQKDQLSAENEIVSKDVLETYVPVMNDERQFVGAFEVYFYMTEKLQAVSGIMWMVGCISIAISLFLLGLFAIYCIKQPEEL